MKYKDIKRYLTIDKSEINAYISLVMKARNAYIDERKQWISIRILYRTRVGDPLRFSGICYDHN